MNKAEIMINELDTMSLATNYNQWLFDQIQPYVGSDIVEIGAGVGNNTGFLLSARRLVCLEPMPEAAACLRKRFQGHENLEVVEGSITDVSVVDSLGKNFDTAVCSNVLEHIEDDFLAARHTRKLLVDGGRFLLIVPAIPFLYGTIDKAVGHYRRYMPSRLRAVVEPAGFHIESLEWMNMPGAFAWLLTNRLFRQGRQSTSQVAFYDRVVVPITRRMEKIIHVPFGQSLVVIARAEI